MTFELTAILFNVIWWYARHDRRLFVTTIDSTGVRAIAPLSIKSGTLQPLRSTG